MPAGCTACTRRSAMLSSTTTLMGTSRCSRRWRSSGRPDIGALDIGLYPARNLISIHRPAIVWTIRKTLSHADAEPALAPELPGDAAILHEARDGAAQLLLDHRPPRD